MAIAKFNTQASTGAVSGKNTTVSVKNTIDTVVPVNSLGTLSKERHSNITTFSDFDDYTLASVGGMLYVDGTWCTVLEKETLAGPIYQVVVNGGGGQHVASMFEIYTTERTNFVALQEVYNIDEIPMEKDPIDVSYHSNDPYSNVIPNVYNTISLTLELNYVAEFYDLYKKWFDGYQDVGQVVTAKGLLLGFELTSGNNTKFLQQGTLTFNGYITAVSPTYAYADRVTHEIGILVDGNVVHTTVTNAAY